MKAVADTSRTRFDQFRAIMPYTPFATPLAQRRKPVHNFVSHLGNCSTGPISRACQESTMRDLNELSVTDAVPSRWPGRLTRGCERSWRAWCAICMTRPRCAFDPAGVARGDRLPHSRGASMHARAPGVHSLVRCAGLERARQPDARQDGDRAGDGKQLARPVLPARRTIPCSRRHDRGESSGQRASRLRPRDGSPRQAFAACLRASLADG